MKALSVTEISEYLKKILRSDYLLSNVTVRGEISQMTKTASKHCFFSIKDKNDAVLNCVFFRVKDHMDDFRIGMEIIVQGAITTFPARSNYQLVATSVSMHQEGVLYKQLELLKQKLQEEGLFLQDKKRPIPKVPKAIGVITSSTGAAVHDLMHVIHRRMPMTDIIIYPSLVQGIDAPKALVQGIEFFNAFDGVDTVIIGRGGGSFEDLFAFQEEVVVRAVAASKHPIISAVGHEADVVLTDHAADLRAPTPTAAGELATLAQHQLHDTLDHLKQQFEKAFIEKLDDETLYLSHLYERLERKNPMTLCLAFERQLEACQMRLNYSVQRQLEQRDHTLAMFETTLQAHNPYAVLRRGYAFVTKQNAVVSSIKNVKPQESIEITLYDGKINAKILKIEKGDTNAV